MHEHMPYSGNSHDRYTDHPAWPREETIRENEERVILTRTLKLIHDFAEMLVADPLGVELRDEMELPVSKETMIDCFSLVLMAETRPEWRTAFYNSGLKLAHFWPGIGPDRLVLPAALFDNGTDPDGRRDRLLANADLIRTFSEAYSKVGPEHRRIAAIFDDAVSKLTGLLGS